MVWPIKPDGVAIGENVRSEAHEGQSQRYRFMNGLLQSRVLRSEMDMRERARVIIAEAQHLGNSIALSLHPQQGGCYARSHVAGVVQRCYRRI